MRFFLVIFLALGVVGVVGAVKLSASLDELERDLSIANYWTCKIAKEKLPVTYNFFLQGGYFMMPSARMGQDGELSLGFSSVPPYYNYNVRMQVMPNVEISGSYRVFRGVEDALLSPHGFGDFSDKGVNIKLGIIKPEDSDYCLPGISIGWDDFLGTKGFEAQYIVLTQLIPSLCLEASLGWGRNRIRGFFGGIQFSPFYASGNPYLEGLSIGCEYDAIAYHDPIAEHHPGARKQRWKINYGLKYRLFESIDLSIAHVKGNELAVGASIFYNFGETEGFLPKIDNRLPYTNPVNQEPINCYRTEDLFSEELFMTFCEQGFELLDLYLYYDSCLNKVVRLKFKNLSYSLESEVRNRLTHLLAALLPSDIDLVYADQVSEGFTIQEYQFLGTFLREFNIQAISPYEMALISPLQEVTCMDSTGPSHLFHKGLPWFNYALIPRTHTYFGSSKGKFKYAVGLTYQMYGFLTSWEIYYRARLGYLLFSYLNDASDVDMLNPSQLINVHTDIINYEKQRGLLFDELFIQKNLAIGSGFYSRGSLGLFNPNYGGVSGEILYYPITSPFACGIEASLLFKRTLKGLGFTNRIRKLDGFIPTYQNFIGSQFFVDLYYDWYQPQLAFKLSVGKFLANDFGARFEASRYFNSGLRISLWYTMTNGNDKVNGHTYYDKGIAISMPLDIFFTSSSLERFGYGLSAWLRDVGFRSTTGEGLYDLIYFQRQ
ncbi:YjbH domain-containing protein [Chlamydiales bacterium]|nr:YjbH domain-containing protein [Chlamydiales bacterium]